MLNHLPRKSSRFSRRQKPQNEDDVSNVGNDSGGDENVQIWGRSKRTKPQVVPTRARGRGHTTQQGSSSAPGGRCPMIKFAGTGDEGDRLLTVNFRQPRILVIHWFRL
jgi:hypothetical protein